MYKRQVKALRGDVTLPRLGLDEADYQALCAECTHIVHSAGNVRMNLPIEQARHSSVDSAQNIIALAHDSPRLEKVEFVSTVGVGGRTHGAVPEEWILTPRGFHNTYEQAKAEAEDVIRAELEHGMALTVHRPSMVVGDTISGRIIHFQVFYHLCEFLSGRRTLGLAPGFGVARLDIVPADYVAKIIAWSSGTDITTVSYTHLDVYKRQGVGRATGSEGSARNYGSQSAIHDQRLGSDAGVVARTFPRYGPAGTRSLRTQ